MYITISRTGSKQEVIESLRKDPGGNPVEKAMLTAVANHLEDHAADGSVGVSGSLSLSYTPA